MRSSRLVGASDGQCHSRNSPGFNRSILRHRGICGAADEAENTKKPKNLLLISLWLHVWCKKSVQHGNENNRW